MFIKRVQLTTRQKRERANERTNERNKNKNLWIVKFMCDLKQFIIEPHMEKPYHICGTLKIILIFPVFSA